MSKKALYKDAFNFLLGDYLGSGGSRDVYVYSLDKTKVIKIERSNDRQFANIFEHEFWLDNMFDESVYKWLAPCISISAGGRILIQERVSPLPLDYKFPKKLPTFLTDFKRSNFGLLKGKLVCIDYALTINHPKTKLKKVSIDSDIYNSD